MRKRFLIPGLLAMASCVSLAQSSAASQSPAKPAAPVSNRPTAIIDTSVGKMTCTLFPDKAPIGVANFIGLATGTKDWKNPVTGATKHGVPLYDGTIFHRVIPGFMIQGGDPAGTGSGNDPIPPFKNEISPDLLFDRPGRLAYANTGQINSNSSQFFITEVATPHLNGGYTIFGQCDEPTVALVKQVAHMARDPGNDKPLRAVRIAHVTIQKAGASSAAAKSPSTAAKKPTAATKPKSANPVDK